jgi:hypothetical protein
VVPLHAGDEFLKEIGGLPMSSSPRCGALARFRIAYNCRRLLHPIEVWRKVPGFAAEGL